MPPPRRSAAPPSEAGGSLQEVRMAITEAETINADLLAFVNSA